MTIAPDKVYIDDHHFSPLRDFGDQCAWVGCTKSRVMHSDRTRAEAAAFQLGARPEPLPADKPEPELEPASITLSFLTDAKAGDLRAIGDDLIIAFQDVIKHIYGNYPEGEFLAGVTIKDITQETSHSSEWTLHTKPEN